MLQKQKRLIVSMFAIGIVGICILVMALSGVFAGAGAPVPANGDLGTPGIVEQVRFKYLSAGHRHSVAIDTNNRLWAWGNNANGQLGDGTTINRNRPMLICDTRYWVSVAANRSNTFNVPSHTLAVTETGELWVWGSNSVGQLGLGYDSLGTNFIIPTRVGYATNWASVVAGEFFSLALTKDGELFAWGANNFGQLGLGDNIDKYTPVQVGSGNNWGSISVGVNHTLALTKDGEIFAWGNNTGSRLGDGTSTHRNEPVLICDQMDWISICAGHEHSVALTLSGEIWIWGSGTGGALGLGVPGNRDIPTMVTYPSRNWSGIAAGQMITYAITTDGELFSVGFNNFGQLGNGTNTVSATLLTQIGSAIDWYKVIVGAITIHGIDDDGELWSWGSNGSAQIGDGTTTHRNVPTHISVTITTLATPEIEVTRPTVSGHADMLNVSWTASQGAIGYILRYRVNNGAWSDPITVITTTHPHIMTGLGEWEFQVTAISPTDNNMIFDSAVGMGTITANKIALTIPSITGIINGYLQWNSTDSHDTYAVCVNGVREWEGRRNGFKVTTVYPQTHVFRVRALSNDTDWVNDSDKSTELSYAPAQVRHTVTIVRPAAGGQVTINTMMINDGQSLTRPQNPPSRPGYIFFHWSTTPPASGISSPEFIFGGKVTEDIRLYEIWKQVPVEESFPWLAFVLVLLALVLALLLLFLIIKNRRKQERAQNA